MPKRLAPLPSSAGHTPIYKLHRYFARRPHNQFRALIEQVSSPGAVILDCMAGGGVTLVEGLTIDRRVISADVNPVAALVQRAQVAEWDAAVVQEFFRNLVDDLPPWVRTSYSTECPDCSQEARIRWFECAYRVRCPQCSSPTSLTNADRPERDDGRPAAGRYACRTCSHEFRAVDVQRFGHEYLNARIRCHSCGHHQTREATESDVALADRIASSESEIAQKYGLEIPTDRIPESWDRQHEDALLRKGFERFSDLFTPRNRIILAFLLQSVRRSAGDLDEEDRIGAIAVVSSLIRYVNNMTVATPGWMDGRPVAWAKHAYWTPNQFVECNPFEYLENRIKAMRLASNDRTKRFRNKRHADDPRVVVEGGADYSVLRVDASSLPIAEGSVDAVITDPPFGSNVQYGELTALWSVWLGDLNPYAAGDFMGDEVLVTRRTKLSPKSFDFYRAGLTRIFLECFRVLKPDGALVFTFNNKSPDAWHAVMRAAFDAGFSLDPQNISYQHEIQAYRDTAHLRFKSELQGDVVYAFGKGEPPELPMLPPPDEWRDAAVARLADDTNGNSLQELRIATHLESLGLAAAALQRGDEDRARRQMEVSQSLVSEAGRR